MSRFKPVLPLACLLALASTAHALEPQLVTTPRARALPVSATNRPLLGAAQAQTPVQLTPRGYAEGELVVSGYASVYEWTGAPRDAALNVRAANQPYATRVLVRRPVDPARASGLVVVELLDPAASHDVAPLWALSAEHFLRRGDVWVGVTVKPSAAAVLQRFDAVRYGALGFRFSQAAECRANGADSEDGLAFDAIAQVGALLRSSSKENPLLDVDIRHVIAAGYAQAGGYVTTFANALHRIWRLGDGAPVFDGYLNAAGVVAAPINQCAPVLADDDARRDALPRDVPFVRVLTESDLEPAASLRRDDSDAATDFFRLYEIAGSAHAGPFAAGTPGPADLRIAGVATSAPVCTEARSDYPTGLAFNAIWLQYHEWLAVARPMASVARIATDPAQQPVPGEDGNATGGWRLPAIDVPVARYAGHSTPRDAGGSAREGCALTGSMQAFTAAQLKARYGTRNEYLRRYAAAVDQAVLERRLVAEDGEALKKPAARTLPAF